MKRSCQRQTTVLLTPALRMISAVPQPSAVQQHDPCPPDVLLRSVSVGYDRLQLVTIRATHVNLDAGAHPADSHFSEIAGIPNRTRMSGFIH
jgi:hypothetical protein